MSLTAINVRGVRDTVVTSNFLTVGKLVPILLFITVGLFSIKPSAFKPLANPSYGDWEPALFGNDRSLPAGDRRALKRDALRY